MKKLVKYISILLLAALLAACLFALVACKDKEFTSEHSYSEVYARGEVTLEADSAAFRILKINDTHLISGSTRKDKKTLAELKTVLDGTQFDMIILDGDIFEGYNAKLSFDKPAAAKIVGDLIDGYGKPWTFAPGNNDGQRGGSNEDIIAFWLGYGHFLAGNTEGINGAMQFFIDINYEGRPAHSIAIMDSLSLDADDNYDYIKRDQIEALIAGIRERSTLVSIFFHMPTPAFKKAYTEGEPYGNFPFSDEYPVDDIPGNALFDELTCNINNIGLISVGHVHSNNMAYYYNNRYYQLSSLGGYGAVGANKTSPSYTMTTVDLTATDSRAAYVFEKLSA